METQVIANAVKDIMDLLRLQRLSISRLGLYQSVYTKFQCYLVEQDISKIDEQICLDYVYHKTGIRFKSFNCTTGNVNVNNYLRPLMILVDYLNNGYCNFNYRQRKPPFICPDIFLSEYDLFCTELMLKGYRETSIRLITSKIHYFVNYIHNKNLKSSNDITIQTIDSYLSTLTKNKNTYIDSSIYSLKLYLHFLSEKGFLQSKLDNLLPKRRNNRKSTISYVWSKTDIQKLLDAVDRTDPKGKRDYAVLLLAVRLGLRVSDIRNLKLSSIDWNHNEINLIMVKTNQHIKLPLLKDVGWAIIDYLKNGRPITTSACLFVKHKAPFNELGGRNSFNYELHRYIVKAGLNIPVNNAKGMHTFRHSLAKFLLEEKTPLHCISESLGHQSVDATSVYIEIDVEGLRKCSLDPEVVFLK
jgi:site-specific recombinase XerD